MGTSDLRGTLPLSASQFRNNSLANSRSFGVFVSSIPTHEDLRACVKAIQEDRQKRRAVSVPQSRATSSRIGDAHLFEYQPNSLGDNATELAARGVGEAEEAECYAQYDFEMEECQVARATFQDSRTYLLCKQRAFENFQRCRGY